MWLNPGTQSFLDSCKKGKSLKQVVMILYVHILGHFMTLLNSPRWRPSPLRPILPCCLTLVSVSLWEGLKRINYWFCMMSQEMDKYSTFTETPSCRELKKKKSTLERKSKSLKQGTSELNAPTNKLLISVNNSIKSRNQRRRNAQKFLKVIISC